jgi:GNAT superfamily N-acetyltransferase
MADYRPRLGAAQARWRKLSGLNFAARNASYHPMKIRRALASDAATITEFNIRLAEETENLRLDPQTVASGVRALLEDFARGVYFVAEHDGRVVGQLCITYEWSDWRNGNFWWIQSVYVNKEFRGQGVFATLFAHVQALARKQKDVCGLRLYMEKDNERARRTYEKLGLNQTHYLVFEKMIGA